MRRSLPILAALAFLAGLVWLFRVVQRFDPTQAGEYSTRAGGLGDISIRLENALLISRTAGRREWSVRADRVDLIRSTGGDLDNLRAADFSRIHDGVFYREGKPEAFFSAQHALYDQPQRRFDVSGGIHLKSVKDDTLESDSLVWSERDDFVRFPRGAHGVFRKNAVSAPNLLFSPKKRTVQCPQGAQGVFNGNPLQASQLFWDVDRERVNCPGTVSGQFRSMSFTAQGADLDLKTQRTTMNKPVIDLRIEGENDLDHLLEKPAAGNTPGDTPMKPRTTRLLTGTAAVITLAGYGAGAQTPSKPAPQPPSTKASDQQKAQRLHVVSEVGEYSDATGIGWAEKVTATDPETNTVFHADRFDWNDKTKTAYATGSLYMNDPDADITAEKATIYYGKSKKLIVLTGTVHILAKPKKKEGAPTNPGPAPVEMKDGKATVQNPPDQSDDADNPKKYPADITCDKAEYTYAKDKKYGNLTGHLKAVQKLPDKTRTLTAGRGEWFGLEKRMLLHEPVHFEDTKGMVGNPKGDVTVFTEEGNERIIMKSGGVFDLRVEDEDEVANKPPAPVTDKKPVVKP